MTRRRAAARDPDPRAARGHRAPRWRAALPAGSPQRSVWTWAHHAAVGELDRAQHGHARADRIVDLAGARTERIRERVDLVAIFLEPIDRRPHLVIQVRLEAIGLDVLRRVEVIDRVRLDVVACIREHADERTLVVAKR